MWTLQQLNPSLFLGLGPCTLNGVQYATCSSTSNTDARRRLNLEHPGFGNLYGDIPKIAAEGNASYNAMLLSVQRNARGVTLNANYTWSHCISDHPQPGQTAFGTTPNVGWSGGNRRSDPGNCSQSSVDRRHIFNLSAVTVAQGDRHQLPRKVSSNRRLSQILDIY